eukprot:6848274-Prymnesium_polylepis.1
MHGWRGEQRERHGRRGVFVCAGAVVFFFFLSESWCSGSLFVTIIESSTPSGRLKLGRNRSDR